MLSTTATLDFCRTDFGLSWRLLESPPRDSLLDLLWLQRILRELEELTESVSVIYQQSWIPRKVPADQSSANVMPSTRGSRRRVPVSLTSVPRKNMGHIILSAIMGRTISEPGQVSVGLWRASPA